MDWGLWCSFVLASLAMGIVPGPGVMSIVGCAVGSGRRVALASVAGMAVGNALAMSLSLAGVGALLAASAFAFSVVKWAGALYLVGLGLVTVFKTRTAAAGPVGTPPLTAWAAFSGNVAIGTFHPKTIIFFVAFVPHFMNPAAGYLGQAVLLVATFTLTVAATDMAYALAAARAGALLRRPRAALWSRRAGGGILVAAGIATATARQ